MVNSGLDGVVFYSLGSFLNPLQFATLAAEKTGTVAPIQDARPTRLHQLHRHSPPEVEAEAAVMILNLLCGLGQALGLHDLNYASCSPVGCVLFRPPHLAVKKITSREI